MELKKKENKIIKRSGAKDDDIKYFLHLLPKDIKRVIEPFGGSFAISRRVYYADIYEKIVNDNDPSLFYAYKNINIIRDANIFINELKDSKILDSEIKKKVIEKYKDSPALNYILQNNFIRGNIVKKCDIEKTYSNKNIDEMKKIQFCNEDYKNIIEKYRNDKHAFIFLDPPYLFSNNSGYFAQSDETDMTDIIVYLLDLIKSKKTKCKIMLVINKLKILSYLFNGYIKMEYHKIYQISKKGSYHLVITNYDL